MIRATFLGHSGFLVELADVCLLFDWWKGTLPPLPQKPLAVFVSHRHEDHFSPAVFSLADGTRPVRFVLGKDIRPTEKNRARWGLTEEILSLCSFLGGSEQTEVFPGVTVETLPSTDEGVAFVVDACGRTIYHAGDLHWWHWEGEDKAWNNNMAANYKREIKELDGCRMDVAFVPLDGRLENAYYWGMKYFLEHVPVKAVFPMHCWDHYEICQKVQDEPSMQGLLEHFHPIEYKGQEWTLC